MKLFALIFLIIPCHVLPFEFITGSSFLIGAAISYFYGSDVVKVGQKIADITFCYSGVGLYECCGKPWIKNDIDGLIADLKQHVFGQHIAQQIIPSAIAANFYKIKPTKPLVMSFHGWTGIGKNYVVSFIAKNFFKEGEKSKFYHLINSRNQFPLEKDAFIYQEQLKTWISSNVSFCPYSVFIFDEVDRMPPGVLDGIIPFLDHHEIFNGVDYRKATFIFISNTGASLIMERYFELWRKYGKTREQMTLNDFDNIIIKGAFNEKGGLQASDLIDHSLIDHFVPFLPLERSHVEQCIKAELEKYSVNYDKDIIQEIMKVVVFGPKPENLFSNAGCKRIGRRVSAFVQQKKLKGSSEV